MLAIFLSLYLEQLPELVIDGWKVKQANEIETKECNLIEEYDGLHIMEEVEQEKYLGDIISSDGKNSKNVTSRRKRGVGIVTQIMAMLEELCLGKYNFEVALILRNSLLISSLLTNAEAWYNVSDSDITELEKVDESLFRRVLETPSSTPKEMLYL